ncbi:MAG: T9SS type A sorting domain-containing protein [Tannerella sp.]|jgi:hypothetical protein|nr:T9SS type A sorting domain-containing protein [Tannerella sp.]
MKKNSFRKRLGWQALAVILSLFAVFGSLHAEKITYHRNLMDGPALEETVVAGTTVTVTDKGLSGSGYVVLGWNTVRVPLVISAAVLETMAAKIGTFYPAGSSFTVAGDTTLYAVWAVDKNNDGIPDYNGVLLPPILSRERYEKIMAEVNAEIAAQHDGVSLRSLPDWDGRYDLLAYNERVYYTGCSYMADGVITLNSAYTFSRQKAHPKIPMDLHIIYGGVLEENSMVGGKAQKPLSKIEITADMLADPLFSVDTVINAYPFMFNAVKEGGGEAILQMYFTKAGTDDIVSMSDFCLATLLAPSLPGQYPFTDPETGDSTNILTIKFNIYDKPAFTSEIVPLRVDTGGRINIKHASGTPLKYMMRSIDGQPWQRADAPLSNREKANMGEGVGICLREIDNSIGFAQVYKEYLLSEAFLSPTDSNYPVHTAQLITIMQTEYAAPLFADLTADARYYNTSDPAYFLWGEGVYNMLMSAPGATHGMTVVMLVMMAEMSFLPPTLSSVAIPVGYASHSQYINDLSFNPSFLHARMPAYGRQLAEAVVYPDPCRETFCRLSFETKNYPTIYRAVHIPQVAGVITVPEAGTHYVESQGDFTFSVKHPSHPANQLLMVQTNRLDANGEPEELTGELNIEDGDHDYIIRRITHDITLKFGPELVSVDNASIDGGAVWSYNNTINIRVPDENVASIYSIAGQLVKRLELSAGDNPVPMERGVYIVTLQEGKKYKVIVK